MACEKNNIAKAKILQSSSAVSSLEKISKRLDVIDSEIAQLSGDASSVKRLDKLSGQKERLQASFDATAVGSLLTDATKNNSNILGDIVNSLKGSGFYFDQAIDILESVQDVSKMSDISKYLKEFSSKETVESVIEAAVNSVKVDEYYKSIFKNFKRSGYRNTATYKKILGLLGDSELSLNHYIVFQQLYNPKNTFKLNDVLKSLKSEKGAIVDPETLVSNIRSIDHTNTNAALETLEEIAMYNLSTLKVDRSAINAFKDKLIEIKTGLSSKDPAYDLFAVNESILDEALGGVNLRSDRGFSSRLKLFGVEKYIPDLQEAKDTMMDLVRGKIDKATIGGKEYKNKNKHELLTILGPREIFRALWRGDKTTGDIAEIISDGFSIKDPAKLEQMVGIVQRGDEGELAEFIKQAIKGSDFLPGSSAEQLVSFITSRQPQLDKPSVFFDVKTDIYKNADKDTFESVLRRERVLDGHSIDSQYKMDFLDDLSTLESQLSAGKIKNIFVSSISDANYAKLHELVGNYSYKGSPIEIVSGDAALGSFSYGYNKNTGNITVRGNSESLLSEIVSKMYFLDIPLKRVLDPVDNVDPIFNLRKSAGLSYMNVGEQDFAAAVRSFYKKPLKNHLEKFLDILVLNSYDTTGVSIKASDEDLMDALYDFFNAGSIGPNPNMDEAMSNKIAAFNRVRGLLGLSKDLKMDHFVVSRAIFNLSSKKYDVNLTLVKSMMDTYMKNGTIDPGFINAFRNLNQKALDASGLRTKDIIKNAFDEAIVFARGSDSGSVPAPRSGVGYVLGDTDARQILAIREASQTRKASGPDFEAIESAVNSIADDYAKRKKDLIDRGGTEIEHIRLDEQFNQNMDEIEFSMIEPQLGLLFEPFERSRYLGGRKFNKLEVRTKDDLGVLDDIVDNIKLDNANKLDEAKKRISSDPRVKNIDGKKVLVTPKDELLKKSESGILDGILPRVSADDVKKMTNADALAKLNDFNDIAAREASSKGFIKMISEFISPALKQWGYFDNYKIIETAYGKMPDAIARTDAENIEFSRAMQIKSDIFKRISKRFTESKPEDLTDFARNQKEIDEIVSDELRSFTDENPTVDISGFAQELRQFDVYAHVTPVSSKSLNDIREFFSIEDTISRNEWEDYFRVEDELPSGFLKADDYEGITDPDVRKMVTNADKFYKETIEREIVALEDVRVNLNNFYAGLGKLTARDVSAKNRRTNGIYKATDTISDSAGRLFQSMEGLFARSNVFDWTVLDTRAAFDVFKNKSIGKFLADWVLDDKKIRKFRQSQDTVKDLIDVTDTSFATSYNSGYKNGVGGKMGLEVARYFRDLRKALGTDGLGAGPTRSRQVNIAIHNMHLSYLDIGKGNVSKKDLMDGIIGFQNGVGQRAILQHLNSPSVKAMAGDDWAKIKFDGSDVQTIGEDQIVRSLSDVEIDEGAAAWNELFGSSFDRNEFLTMAQAWTGYANQSKWATYAQWLGRGLKAMPFAGPISNYMQLFWPYVTGMKGVLGYASLMNGLRRQYDAFEVEKAGRLRQVFGFGDEIGEPNSIASLASEIRGVGGIDEFAARTAATKGGFFQSFRRLKQDAKDLQAYDHLVNGEKYGFMNAILKTGVDKLFSGKVGRTLDFTTANGNNLYDFLFLGHIKDYAFYQAMRQNSYRNFNTVDDFKKFINEADPKIVDELSAEIKATAQRLLGDYTGTNFSSSNRIVNPYTGARKHAFDGAVMFQRMSSYLNGWGRNRTTGFARFLGQTINLVTESGLFLSRQGRRDAIDFIKNTPEYKFYIKSLVEDVVSAVRYANMTDEDGEVEPADFIRGLQTVSQAYQAGSIVGELRPFFGLVESSAGITGGLTRGEQFIADWNSVIFSNLNVTGRTLEFYKDVARTFRTGGTDNVISLLSKYMIDISAGSLDFMIGKNSSGGRVISQGDYDPTRSFLGEDYTNPLQGYKYDTMALGNMRQGFTYDDGGIQTPFFRLNKIFSQLDGLNKAVFDHDANIVGLADMERAHFAMVDAFQNTDTYKQVEQTGNVIIGAGETNMNAKFERNYITPNPFIGTANSLFGKIKNYKDKGSKYGYTDFDDSTEFLFDHMGEERLEEFRSKYSTVQKALDNWNKVGEDGGPTTQEVRQALDSVNERDRQFLLIRLQEGKTATGKANILRRAMNSELFDVMEEFKGEGKYQALGAMKEISRMYGQRISAEGEGAEEQKIEIYNAMAPILSEIAPLQTERYITDATATRHNEQMNEELGWEAFTWDKEKDYWKANYLFENSASQLAGIQDAVRKGDFSRAAAEVNILSTGAFGFSDADKVGAMYGTIRLLEMVDGANLADTEKAHVKYLIMKNSADVIDYDLAKEELGEGGEEFLDAYYKQLYKTEEEMSVLGIDGVIEELNEKLENDDPLGDYLDKLGKKKPTSPKAAKKAQIAKADVEGLLKDLGSKLDSNRSTYKNKSFPIRNVSRNVGRSEAALKAKYPMKISANTKTITGLTKKGLSVPKDIKRNIKPKKRKKLTPPLL